MMLSNYPSPLVERKLQSRRHHRAGMTLVELLTALGIMILLAAIAVPTILSVIRGDRLRDASSSVQGFITAARERAALDNRPRGVRLVQDPDNPELVRQLIMIREADPVAPGGSLYGGAIVTNRFGANNYSSKPSYYDTVEVTYDQQFVNSLLQSQTRGLVRLTRYDATSTFAVVRGVLRIGSSGPFRAFSYFPDTPGTSRNFVAASSPYPARTLLVLDEPLPNSIGIDNGYLAASGVGVEISRPPIPLEGVEPLILPQGIVIDLGQLPQPTGYPATLSIDSSSQRLTKLTPRMLSLPVYSAGVPIDFGFDILFSPQRNVIGPGAVDDRVILWIRDETGVNAESNQAYVTQPASGPTTQTLNQAAISRKQLNITSSTSNSLVVLMTRTGALATFKPVLQDEITESSQPNASSTQPDGYYDFIHYYDNVNANVGVND